MATQRDPWLDNAKMGLVVLVVLGHTWALLPSDARAAWHLYDFVYLWHMPVLEALQAAGVGRWPWLAPGLVLLAALTVAMASFLLFERPWREVRLPRAVRPHSVPGAG